MKRVKVSEHEVLVENISNAGNVKIETTTEKLTLY